MAMQRTAPIPHTASAQRPRRAGQGRAPLAALVALTLVTLTLVTALGLPEAHAKCGDGTSVWTATGAGSEPVPRNVALWVGVGGALTVEVAKALQGARWVAGRKSTPVAVRPGPSNAVSSGVDLWVLTPQRPLKAKTRYTLALDKARVAKVRAGISGERYQTHFTKVMATLQGVTVTTSKAALRKSSAAAPVVTQATFSSRALGCGPSRHLSLETAQKRAPEQRYRVTLVHVKTGKRHQVLSRGLSVGHGMCRGLFRGWEPGVNRVTLQLVDAAGNVGPASKAVEVDVNITSRNSKR